MKKAFTLFLFTMIIGLTSFAQTMVAVNSNFFLPADITITVGETVQWDNNSGGTHNVNGTIATYPGNPEDFTSGGASSAAWSFSHTFNTAGSYDYRCDPHFGLGMFGTITVMEPPVLTNGLVIAGVFDAQPSNAGAKGIELYTLEDIPDLSIFGLGSANNGGGSDGQEFTFPAMAMAAGTCFYVTDDSTKFADFFGFNADFVEGSGGTTATGLNGDDAIELFENGTVIDVFGEIDVDGTGQPWEHLDGWAYRVNGTGPDGSTFVLDNWTFSGVDGLDGSATNADAPVPYTNCVYSLSDLTNALLIAGVFDAQPGAAGAKGIELYALEDIPDLSIFGLGSANNGGGTDSVEYSFPALSMAAGTCFFITDDSTKFADFFGFNADFVEGSGGTTATGINGDDAVELFENGEVIDVFGEIGVDGTGQPWEHLDGWAYRKNGTGPDGSTFVLDNWIFSGVDALQGFPTNNEAPIPYTNCTYSPIPPSFLNANDDSGTTDANTSVNINVLGNDELPSGYTTVTVDSGPANGTATVVVADGSIDYTPADDYCGPDSFTYIVCDPTSACDTATVTIDVICPTVFPQYPIELITTVNQDGVADSLGIPVEVTGIVYGVDLQGSNDDILFTLIDKFNPDAGMSVFGDGNFGYTVTEGDEVIVRGFVDQFRGLTQIRPVDTLWMVSSGNNLHDPEVVTSLGEDTESKLIKFENMSFVDPGAWVGDGSGFNIDITNGVETVAMRIDDDVDWANMPVPPYAVFNVTGIGGQFDFDAPFDEGYQILPRYMQDIEEVLAVIDPTISEKVSFYPNPVSETLVVTMSANMERLVVTNVLGQTVHTIENPESLEEINVSKLTSGIYMLTFVSKDGIWSSQFVKK